MNKFVSALLILTLPRFSCKVPRGVGGMRRRPKVSRTSIIKFVFLIHRFSFSDSVFWLQFASPNQRRQKRTTKQTKPKTLEDLDLKEAMDTEAVGAAMEAMDTGQVINLSSYISYIIVDYYIFLVW